MNFKRISLEVIAFALVVGFTSCKKDCQVSIMACKDKPPNNEACLAYFQSWFYSSNTNSCEQISYSGCAQKGFATLQQCEECKCK